MANRTFGFNNSNDYWTSSDPGFFSKPHFVVDFVRNNPNYEGVLNIVNQNGLASSVERKYIRLRIRNTGSADAPKCKIQMNVTDSEINNSKRHPNETRTLCWNNEISDFIPLERKIGEEYVNLILADSNAPELHAHDGLDIYALTATKESLHRLQNFTPAQDGFGTGDFEIRITVSGGGVSLTNLIKIHVDQNFENTTVIPFEFDSPRNVISRTYSRLMRRQASKPESNH